MTKNDKPSKAHFTLGHFRVTYCTRECWTQNDRRV